MLYIMHMLKVQSSRNCYANLGFYCFILFIGCSVKLTLVLYFYTILFFNHSCQFRLLIFLTAHAESRYIIVCGTFGEVPLLFSSVYGLVRWDTVARQASKCLPPAVKCTMNESLFCPEQMFLVL